MGAGMTGAYLYRLLANKRRTVDIFDKSTGTSCGISPCAWGTSRGFYELVEESGLDASRYILARTDHVVMDGLKIAADLMTFNKPALIRDLLQDAHINASQPDVSGYDRVIDATGVSRTFLPPIEDDIVLSCVQYCIATDSIAENRIALKGIGYAWSFPLSARACHVGCGSLISDPRKILSESGWMAENSVKVRCTCAGRIRLTGPVFSQPFVTNGRACEVWGVGEAIGCVAPLAGDGILAGMKSAELLTETWDDPAAYTKAILGEFKWMESERRVIDKLRRGEGLTLHDAWVLKKNSRRMGMEVGLKEAALLLKHLR